MPTGNWPFSSAGIEVRTDAIMMNAPNIMIA